MRLLIRWWLGIRRYPWGTYTFFIRTGKPLYTERHGLISSLFTIRGTRFFAEKVDKKGSV